MMPGRPCSPVLATKLMIPRVRRAALPRPRLLERLNHGLENAVTTIIAPAGFGKTTLMAQWAEQQPARVAWLALDPADNDPSLFWRYLVSALDRIRTSDVSLPLWPDCAPPPPLLDGLVIPLLNALTEFPADSALVLDDFHFLENAALIEPLAFWLERLPGNFHVFLAARADPPVPIARWRARSQLLELSADELRFTAEESATFLRSSLPSVSVSGATEEAGIARLAERSQGWIAGLHLMSLAVQNRGVGELFHPAGTQTGAELISDYLAQEVLQHQPASVRRFLLLTAQLGTFSAPLCDAVLPEDLTSVSGGSSGLIAQVQRQNLFLASLGGEPGWFRYDALFGEFLREQQDLPSSEDVSEDVPALHLRAAYWFEGQSQWTPAIEHALQSSQWQYAADLIERSSPAALQRGEMATVRSWLGALPSAVFVGRPQLSLFAALCEAVGDNWASVKDRLAEAERTLDRPEGDCGNLMAQFAVLQALLAVHEGDLSRVCELTEQALDCLPESDIYMRSLTLALRSVVQGSPGDAGSSTGLRMEGSTWPSGEEPGTAVLLYLLGCLQHEEGQLAASAAYFRRMLAALSGSEGPQSALAALGAINLGEVLRLQNELNSARVHLTQGVRLSEQRPMPEATAAGHMSLAWVWHAEYQPEPMRHALAAAHRAAAASGSAGLHSRLAALQMHLSLLEGDRSEAASWVEHHLARLGWPAAQAVDATQPESALVSARALIVLGRASDALQLLDEIARALPRRGRQYHELQAMVLRALALDALNERAQALAALGDALVCAEGLGYLRPFLDEGKWLVGLLVEGRRRAVWRTAPAIAAFAERILAAGQAAVSARAIPPAPPERHSAEHALLPAGADNGTALPVDALSQRELEVLGLAATGLSNQEIAERLYISIGTVKSHIHNVFGKLGVKDRAQAAHEALKLGLL
jgi:LuxR family transcriptional regulator, maltose regulon positive regulatory protein